MAYYNDDESYKLITINSKLDPTMLSMLQISG